MNRDARVHASDQVRSTQIALASTAANRTSTRTPNFDRLAGAYRWMELITFGPWLWRCRCTYLGELGLQSQALVLGDGDGRFTARLLSENSTVLIDAVDCSSSMLASMLRRAGPHASRVRAQLADARTCKQDRSDYDLIVTHFFLDCLTTDEVSSLAWRLRACARPGARWVVSEFAIPHGSFGRLVAQPLISFLYRAFGLLTGLKVRRLPDHRKALASNGFVLAHQRPWLFGLLVSEMWEATTVI